MVENEIRTSEELKRITPSPIGLYLIKDPEPFKFGAVETWRSFSQDGNNSGIIPQTRRVKKGGERGIKLSGKPQRVLFSPRAYLDKIYDSAL